MKVQALSAYAHSIRADIPRLATSSWSYLDNAATTQKPQVVIDALADFYAQRNAPVYRSVYADAEYATAALDAVRQQVACFLNAEFEEIIFTKGTTESINFVAFAWAWHTLRAGDVIVLSELEHHANILPWQQLQERGVILRYIPVDATGMLAIEQGLSLLTSDVALVALTLCSNVFGVMHDIMPLVHKARECGARILLDAAQAAPRINISVRDLACDFLVFSSHKMLGPAGVGILYCKKELHTQLRPYQYGGGMAAQVYKDHAVWQKAPYCYEAGTCSVADIVGFGVALEYRERKKLVEHIAEHEAALCEYALNGLSLLPSVRLYGPVQQQKKHGHSVLFTIDGMHAHDVATFLDAHGVAVRAGFMCAQPLFDALHMPPAVRASWYAYTTFDDIARVVDTVAFLVKK